VEHVPIECWTGGFFIRTTIINSEEVNLFAGNAGKLDLERMICTFGSRWGRLCSALIHSLDLLGCIMKLPHWVGGHLDLGQR